MLENIEGFDGLDRQYYANVRSFKGGGMEMVIKTVRPMQMDQIKARFEASGSRSAGYLHSAPEISDFQKQDNHVRAVRRAKQSIRHLCKEAEMDRLLTLTYRQNMQDRDTVAAHFKQFKENLRRRIGREWDYVAVLELQDRGAYHIHCAVRGRQQISVIRDCWYRAIGGTGKEKGDQTLGQVNVTSPQGARRGYRTWSTDKLSSYLTKYLSKTFEFGVAGKRRFWAAEGIKKPQPQRLWLSASSIAEAIGEGVSMLKTFFNLSSDFKMWLSTSNDCFWLAGRSCVT